MEVLGVQGGQRNAVLSRLGENIRQAPLSTECSRGSSHCKDLLGLKSSPSVRKRRGLDEGSALTSQADFSHL